MILGKTGSGITPFFKTIPLKDERKSLDQGRPIYQDVEVCEIRFAGSNDRYVFPIHQYSHWEVDEETGEQRQVTYAERFPKQFQQFRSRQAQTKSGTPLDFVPFLTDSKRSELRALNIYTLEALAELDGQPLKNLGIGGRDLKNKAMDYLATSTHDGIITKQQMQIDELLVRIKAMEQEKLASNPQYALLDGPQHPSEPHPLGPDPIPTPPEKEDEPDEDDGDDEEEKEVKPGPGVNMEFVGMTKGQLRAYIGDRTGSRPVGNSSFATLLRMAEAARVGR